MKNMILLWKNPETLEILKNVLKSNKVALTTTDTILGLLATTDKQGACALDIIKKRCKKPYIILMDSVDKVFSYAKIPNCNITQFIKLCWPGPVTLIFRSKIDSNTIGIRIPDHKGLLKLLSYFDGLYSTSANISGQAVPNSISEVNKEIIESVGCIVVEDNIDIETVPSTILDCTSGKIRVIREGAYPIDKLEKLYGEVFIKTGAQNEKI